MTLTALNTDLSIVASLLTSQPALVALHRLLTSLSQHARQPTLERGQAIAQPQGGNAQQTGRRRFVAVELGDEMGGDVQGMCRAPMPTFICSQELGSPNVTATGVGILDGGRQSVGPAQTETA